MLLFSHLRLGLVCSPFLSRFCAKTWYLFLFSALSRRLVLFASWSDSQMRSRIAEHIGVWHSCYTTAVLGMASLNRALSERDGSFPNLVTEWASTRGKGEGNNGARVRLLFPPVLLLPFPVFFFFFFFVEFLHTWSCRLKASSSTPDRRQMTRDSSSFEAVRLDMVRWWHAECGGTIVKDEPAGIRKEAASGHSLFLRVSMEAN
jgi:hypothetical protein